MSTVAGNRGQTSVQHHRRRSIVIALIVVLVLLVGAGGIAIWRAQRGIKDLGIRTTQPLPASIATAIRAAQANGDTIAVAVLDTRTGSYYGSVDAGQLMPSESVVKVLIAADLLASGQMSGATEQSAYRMITQSDDTDADTLWGKVGGPDVVSWAAQRYGITDLGQASATWAWWGNTKFTARGLTELYAAIRADPKVGPWLTNAMSHMSTAAADGTDQDFGLAAPTAADGHGAFKQGWGDDNDATDCEELNSTGLLDSGRYAVAILTQRVPAEPMSALLPDINSIAAAVAPGGVVVAGSSA